jgi:hypothetical protein
MAVEVTYRHSRFTAAPAYLSPPEIWAVARNIRNQLVQDRFERRLPLDEIPDRLCRLEVNGIAFDVEWDLDHEVLNPAGKPVMGVTEYDKASPECVMVSVNGPKLRSLDTLLRSTIAHELGHVVFDAPGWVLIPPDAPVCTGFSARKSPHDPREVRANEFMGALLVPASLLRVDLQRQAKRLRLAQSLRPSTIMAGAPAYDAAHLDSDSIEEAIFVLAERYGVSESFLRVRLERYDLVRTGGFAQSQ